MAGVDVPRFLGAEVGDNPDTWRAAGLHVDAGGVCNVGSVAFTLTGTGARGYHSLNPGVASRELAGRAHRARTHGQAGPRSCRAACWPVRAAPAPVGCLAHHEDGHPRL